MEQEILDWLVQRAEEEEEKIENKKISKLKFMFTSKKRLAENEKESIKSLGKIELILEIMKKCNSIKRDKHDEAV